MIVPFAIAESNGGKSNGHDVDGPTGEKATGKSTAKERDTYFMAEINLPDSNDVSCAGMARNVCTAL